MPKRPKEPTAYPRVDNGQVFSTLRLIPAINQKNYYTNYLKKDSQYLCRKIRERPEGDATPTAVFHLGSLNLRVGMNNDAEPMELPFCIAKARPQIVVNEKEETPEEKEEVFEEALGEVRQSFVDRMKFYKTRIVPNAATVCSEFNARQTGDPIAESEQKDKKSAHNEGDKICCVTEVPEEYSLFWPLVRGELNEDPVYYRSPQELVSDILDILHYATYSDNGLKLDPQVAADAILVVPDMFTRSALSLFVGVLFDLGFKHVAVIAEAVAATYGAGISAACVVDIGAQTTTVACVDDGSCLAESRIKLEFGSSDITRAFGKLLERINFPGNPNFKTFDALKCEFLTVNEADISVQLYRYYTETMKYDFKVYNEVMLPVLGLFYPSLFTLPPRCEWRNKLFPVQFDPYTGRSSGPLSDADINVRLGTLAVFGQSYVSDAATAATVVNDGETGDVNMLDDEEDDSRVGTPIDSKDVKKDSKDSKDSKSDAVAASAQLDVYETLNLSLPARTALDHAIIESIAQAKKLSGSAKLYYENLLVIGGGSKIPSFHMMLTDRLTMWNQAQIKELGEISVMALQQGMEPESICWRGGCVYSKLKLIDEMWTTKSEWDVLGPRTLHYKAALYSY